MQFYQAITTRYLGPTNYRGARIKATAGDGSVVVSYDHSVSAEVNHAQAREALSAKLDWHASASLRWHSGALHNGDTVHVAVNNTHA